ncbi:MAG: ferrous iron transport protein B [Clostridia bacterium]|nr:ferrous iron transport protein B [Clostridia bacterium]
MGLTKSSVGTRVIDKEKSFGDFREKYDAVVALAGNPNVGKSTVFNSLTGMKQHTGNWAGKTVASAVGVCRHGGHEYAMVDIPGTYSLMSSSKEEEVARNFLCFSSPDVSVVVCDATCLERNLNLVLQIMEVSKKTVICVNLLDEAKRKGIEIDTELLSSRLGVSVVGVVGRDKKSLGVLLDAVSDTLESDGAYRNVTYCDAIEDAVSILSPVIEKKISLRLNPKWVSLRLLDGDETLVKELSGFVGFDVLGDEDISLALNRADEHLRERGFFADILKEAIASTLVREAEDICEGVVSYEKKGKKERDRSIDKVLTSRAFGYPVMIAFLATVFFITISGANAISELISTFLFYIEGLFGKFLLSIGTPDWLYGALVLGIFRVLAWVVSVMLPPMAIFFPLFTLLEDVGYLPRIAYNLDKPFSKCSACGKQALTMCMGFGCNAAGVVGCRIIDSPRERLLATLTNCFVPCNGKFPMLIALISIFFIGGDGGFFDTLLSALLLTAVILLGVAMTFFCTWLLSKTLLRGTPSSFTLELPPYRRPQIFRVLVRSVLDRTVFVLARAAAIAAPAGLVIWLMANITVGDVSLLRYIADFLDPFASLMGLDGVILVAFILGLPANEIVIPIIIMAYLAEGSIAEIGSLDEMRRIFVDNGWDFVTAGSVILFSLLHSPCATTLMTVKKETGSFRWALLSAVLPTVIGIIVCIIFANLTRLFI